VRRETFREGSNKHVGNETWPREGVGVKLRRGVLVYSSGRGHSRLT
jgi:hypothetical protein